MIMKTNSLNRAHIKSFDQTFSKVCDESQGFAKQSLRRGASGRPRFACKPLRRCAKLPRRSSVRGLGCLQVRRPFKIASRSDTLLILTIINHFSKRIHRKLYEPKISPLHAAAGNLYAGRFRYLRTCTHRRC